MGLEEKALPQTFEIPQDIFQEERYYYPGKKPVLIPGVYRDTLHNEFLYLSEKEGKWYIQFYWNEKPLEIQRTDSPFISKKLILKKLLLTWKNQSSL